MASLNGTRCQFRAVFNLLSAPSASANQKKERRGLSAGQAPTRATGMLPGSAKKKLFGKLFGGGGVSIWGCVIPYWRLLLWFVMAVGMGVRHSLLFVIVPSPIFVTSCLEAYSPPLFLRFSLSPVGGLVGFRAWLRSPQSSQSGLVGASLD